MSGEGVGVGDAPKIPLNSEPFDLIKEPPPLGSEKKSPSKEGSTMYWLLLEVPPMYVSPVAGFVYSCMPV
jgi:hypothetical protein